MPSVKIILPDGQNVKVHRGTTVADAIEMVKKTERATLGLWGAKKSNPERGIPCSYRMRKGNKVLEEGDVLTESGEYFLVLEVGESHDEGRKWPEGDEMLTTSTSIIILDFDNLNWGHVKSLYEYHKRRGSNKFEAIFLHIIYEKCREPKQAARKRRELVNNYKKSELAKDGRVGIRITEIPHAPTKWISGKWVKLTGGEVDLRRLSWWEWGGKKGWEEVVLEPRPEFAVEHVLHGWAWVEGHVKKKEEQADKFVTAVASQRVEQVRRSLASPDKPDGIKLAASLPSHDHDDSYAATGAFLLQKEKLDGIQRANANDKHR
jgi:hypothetical protein